MFIIREMIFNTNPQQSLIINRYGKNYSSEKWNYIFLVLLLDIWLHTIHILNLLLSIKKKTFASLLTPTFDDDEKNVKKWFIFLKTFFKDWVKSKTLKIILFKFSSDLERMKIHFLRIVAVVYLLWSLIDSFHALGIFIFFCQIENQDKKSIRIRRI